MTTMTGFDRKVTKIEWIPVGKISVIWVQAQRPLDEKHARQIAENFDPEMFGILSVTLPNGDGVYHAIDGHHRKVAVEMMGWGGDQKLPCEVFDASDPARAAKLFDKINSARKAPQPIDLFKVRVTAGDDVEVAVDKIVRGNGYHIGASMHDRSISCVQALVSVYRTHGQEPLDSALKIIQATWGNDRNAVNATIVRGYGEFLAEHRHTNWQRLKECIAKRYTPGRFLGAARTARDIDGGSLPSSIKRLLLTNYNRGLKAGAQLQPKTAAEAEEAKTSAKKTKAA